jgi:hypothetical protein
MFMGLPVGGNWQADSCVEKTKPYLHSSSRDRFATILPVDRPPEFETLFRIRSRIRIH